MWVVDGVACRILLLRLLFVGKSSVKSVPVLQHYQPQNHIPVHEPERRRHAVPLHTPEARRLVVDAVADDGEEAVEGQVDGGPLPGQGVERYLLVCICMCVFVDGVRVGAMLFK